MFLSSSWLACGLIASLVAATTANPHLPRADITIPLVAKRLRQATHRRTHTGPRHRGGDLSVLDGASFETEYLVNVTVGGQDFQVILDTGSADFWASYKNFSCFALNGTSIPTADCNFGPAQFDPALSSTFQTVPNTTFFVQYGSGEKLSGPVGFDTLSVGGVSVTKQEFGVPNHNAFLGDGVSEGVLGLGFAGATSVYNDTDHLLYDPFFVNAVKQRKVKNPFFSHSLDRPTFEQKKNDPFIPKLGQLSLGGIVPVATRPNSTATLSVVGYAPDSRGFFLPSFNTSALDYRLIWYSILVDGYNFPGSHNVTTASNSTIIDSGTTSIWLPSPVAAAYNAPWAVFNEELGLYLVDCATKQSPPFSVMLGGKEFAVDGRDMVIPFRGPNGTTVCASGVQDNGPAGDGNIFILGDVFLHNVVVTYNPLDAKVHVTQREPY